MTRRRGTVSARRTTDGVDSIRLRDVAGDPELEQQLALAGVDIVTTAQRLGGRRRWFRCGPCGRRCSTLYVVDDGLACRSCGDLAYPSQREHERQRKLRRAFAIFDRINVAYSQYPRVPGPKPRGMHWNTYWELYDTGMRLDADAIIALRNVVPSLLR